MATVTSVDASQATLPVVDLTSFNTTASEEEKEAKARQLVEACKNVGFVYIKGHDVPQSKIQEAFRISRKFYDLPVEDKMKAPHPPGWAVHRGYSWPGLEKVSNATSLDDLDVDANDLREVQDYKESYEIGSEDNPDMPNIWIPDEILPEWRPFMTEFYWMCWQAARRILQALARGLKIDEDRVLKPHSGHYNQLRLLHYPPIPAAHIEKGKFARMEGHTDWTTITMLFQDDCGGLQVESPTHPGSFIDVAPIADTLVLNIGDLMMRWTDDYLKSTQHRVRLPPLIDRFTGEKRMTRARYSIPYFVTTDPDVTIESLRTDQGQKGRYEPITQRNYSAMRARMQY